MIDPERPIFDVVGRAVLAAFPEAKVSDELDLSASAPLAVFIEMSDCYAVSETADSSSNENHAYVVFEVNVISNKLDGKKAVCKAVMDTIDREFNRLGFSRTAMMPINESSATRYRLFGRYSAVSDKNFTIYRR